MYKPHFFSQNWSQKSRVRLIHGYICLEFSKTYLIFNKYNKLLKVPRKRHKRNWERVAVVKGVFECLSANLALQKFLQAINFRFTRTNKRLQPVTATRIFPPSAIQYHKIREYSRGKWPTVCCFLLASWQIRRLSYQAPVLREVFSLMRVFTRIYIAGIPKSFLFVPTRCAGQTQAQTPPNI